MKRIIPLLLTLAMTFSLAMPAQAASTKASTMRLMDTVGTATVENAAGKNLSIKDNMRLYNGYEVATKDASYAYISLDSSKAVKLDASSAVKVNQSGKKLELDVTSGELMFNVPVALKSDESLNIRTSTMVTGIRGTAGWVNALDRYTTRVAVLEGAVTINSQDPFTGADRAVTITGGQIATIIRHERAMAIQQQLIDDGVIIEDNIIAELTKPGQIVEEIQEADIPGFVAQEVSSNSNLQDRIRDESPLNVDEIIKDAQQRLSEEEKAAEKQNALIEKALNELTATNSGLPFAEPEVIVQTNTVTDRVEVPGGLNNPHTLDVQKVLDEVGIAAVTNPGSNFDITRLTMDPTDVLYVIEGSLDITDPWTVEGTVSLLKTIVDNNSTISVNGTFEIGFETSLLNNGTISVNSTNSLLISGTVDNCGSILVGDLSAGKMIVNASGIVYNGYEDSPVGEIVISDISGSSLRNYGQIFNYAVFENQSEFANVGSFYNLYCEDSYETASLISLSPLCFGVTINTGTIANMGVINNYASFYNVSTDVRISDDVYSIVNAGSLENYGLFYNDSSICAESATSSGDVVAALEMYDGILMMDQGLLCASDDNIALYYDYGVLELGSNAIISHSGGGNGCAVMVSSVEDAAALRNVDDTESDWTSNNYGILYGKNLENLIQVDIEDFDYGAGCDAGEHTQVVAIDRACFPYEEILVSDNYLYCIDLGESLYHAYA